MNRTATAAALVLATALLAAGGCKKGDGEPGADLAKPLAVVGEDTVKVEDVVTYMRAASLDQTIEGRDDAVEDLIAVAVVKQAARDEKLTPEQEKTKTEWENQLRMSAFRDSVIYGSVSVPDSAIETFYKDRVSDEIKARHVLVPITPTATPEQKTAARKKADEALVKARGGADFEKLSREYSESNTASTGGDLGWFGKGDMVPAFERAAFGLKPGEVSDVVETRFGYHVIKVEDRRKKTLQEMRPDIEKDLAAPLQRQAEELYIQRMMSESNLELYEANVDTLVAIFAADSVETPTGARADLPIATWKEGRLILNDVVELYQALPPENRAAVKALDRDRMLSALTPLVRNRMLLARAQAADVKLDPERQAQLDERVEGLLVSEMLRNEVKEGAVVTDSAARAAFRADSAAEYAGRSYEQAESEVRQSVLQAQMAEVNSQAGQRKLVHQIAKEHEAEIEVKRFPDNVGLVLEKLASDSAAAEGDAAEGSEGGEDEVEDGAIEGVEPDDAAEGAGAEADEVGAAGAVTPTGGPASE